LISGQVAKFIVNTVISSSVAATAREVIRNNVANETLVDSIQVRITTMVIGGMVFDQIWKRTDVWFEGFMVGANSVAKDLRNKSDIIEGTIVKESTDE
jgi:hypothetical protein